MTVNEVAAFLQVHTSTVYKMVKPPTACLAGRRGLAFPPCEHR